MAEEYKTGSHCKDCKCGSCQGDQAAAEALFSSHSESGFSGYQGYASNHFKGKHAHGDVTVPGASRPKDDPPFEGRDAKKGQHGSIVPGTQKTGGLIRG